MDARIGDHQPEEAFSEQPLVKPWPTPPAQVKPWIPPGELEEDLKKITGLLFEQGLADPRELRYRAVEIFPQAEVSRMDRAWVFADERYAIGWNGLIYPVLQVGDDVDFCADIEESLAANLKRQARAEAEGTSAVWYLFTPDTVSVSYNSLSPLKAVFLARLGKGELAQRYWKFWKSTLSNPQANLYHIAAQVWLWAFFERALGSFIDGDYRLALSDLEPLAVYWPRVLSELKRQKVSCPMPLWHKPSDDCGYFLEPMETLRQDVRRRLQRIEREEGRTQSGSPQHDIPSLVAAMEDIQGRQTGWPGGLSFREDPIFQALRDSGPAAVKPLIDVLENDHRLTRTVWSSRPWEMRRKIAGVYYVANWLLAEFFELAGGQGVEMGIPTAEAILSQRRRAAALYRSLDAATKNEGQEQRWLALLNFDDAEAKEWTRAAEKLAWLAKQPTKKQLLLEIRPQIVEVMRKRIKYLSVGNQFSIREAIRMLNYFSDIDSVGALEFLQELNRVALSPPPDGYCCEDPWARAWLAAVASRQAALGDPTGLDNWSKCLRQSHYNWWFGGEVLEAQLLPLLEFSELPPMKEFGEWFFLDENSPWRSAFMEDARKDSTQAANNELQPFHRLVQIPAFRKFLLQRLADRRIYAFFTFRGNQLIVEQKGMKEFQSNGTRPTAPQGIKYPLRVQDAWADALYSSCRSLGVPAFEMFSTVGKRDRKLRAVRNWLLSLKPSKNDGCDHF